MELFFANICNFSLGVVSVYIIIYTRWLNICIQIRNKKKLLALKSL